MAPLISVTCHLEVAVGEPLKYWTDQPVRSKGASPALPSSMKSLVRLAPAFPPPPKTSEMTASEDAVACAVNGSAMSDPARPMGRAMAMALTRRPRRAGGMKGGTVSSFLRTYLRTSGMDS